MTIMQKQGISIRKSIQHGGVFNNAIRYQKTAYNQNQQENFKNNTTNWSTDLHMEREG